MAEGTPDELKARLPVGHIRLRFPEEASLVAAQAVFADARRSDDGLSLTLAAAGDVGALRAVLDRLEAHALPVEALSVSAPDLDEVFFALTGAGGSSRVGGVGLKEAR